MTVPPAGMRVLVVAAALVAALAAAPAAWAHPALIETQPGAGYAVTDPPELVAVTFNEPVTPVGDALTLSDESGNAVPLDVQLDESGQQLRGTPAKPLRPAGYVVQYKVVALDGDLIEGTFPFGVATPVRAGSSAGGLSQDDPDRVQPATAVPRALLFVGLALALGGAAGAAMARQALGAADPVRPPVRPASLLGLVGAAVLLVQVTSLSPATAATTVATSGTAQLLAAETALFAVAAALARKPVGGLLAVAALSGVVLLEAVRAHPAEAAAGAGTVLTLVHLGAAAVWVGALVHVVRVALRLRGSGTSAWLVVSSYARVALGLLVLVIGTGTLSALLLLPTLSSWVETTYGRLLLGKLALVALAVSAAVLARRNQRRARAADGAVLDPAGRPWRLRAPAVVEATALGLVLVLTAGVTSATPPALVSQTSLLPAPTGAVVRTAERINHVTVALLASEGRLEARAYAPDGGSSVRYELDVALARPGADARRLDLTSCGEACWTAEVDWARGRNTVHLDVTASGWQGGRGEVAVVWPPRPAADLLRQVQATMGAQREITATESVTSGFGAAPTTTSVRSGQEYLEDEPWSDGGVADPVVVTENGRSVLLFAMPELGYHFRFELDEQDRVAAARIVTRKHLLQREYRYPPLP